MQEANGPPVGPKRKTGSYILLPILNERDNIAGLLDRIAECLDGQPYTVGILDDGSTDGTLEYLEERIRRPGQRLHLTRRRKTARGSQRGGALHDLLIFGLAHTDHDVFVEMDGDLSHRAEELQEGLQLISERGFDVAVASKYVAGSRVINRPWARRLVSRLCSAAVGVLISRRLRDYSNGYRFYTRQAARLIVEYQIRYSSPIYLTEVMALWLRSGLRIIEFPTTYVGRNEGLSKLRITDLIKAGGCVFEIALRYHLSGFARVASQTSLAPPSATPAHDSEVGGGRA